ncbi:MAG: helix-turn-helix transcriptional regulator [Rhizomicrobium sp.]
MAIVVNLDVMLARRKIRSKELAETIGITEANLSLLKSGKVKGVRFETLDKICAALECSPAIFWNSGRACRRRSAPALAMAVQQIVIGGRACSPCHAVLLAWVIHLL